MIPGGRFAVLLLAMAASEALGQQGQRGEPYIGYVYPAGGRRGTTFEATVGGRYLDPTNVHFSGTGVTAAILKHERQVTPTEQKELSERLDKIQAKRKQGLRLSPEEAKQADEIRQKLTRFGRRLTNPSLGEFVTLQVAIAPTAPLGNREIRIETSGGLSNPLTIHVGELPESNKPEWKNVPNSRESMDAQIDPKPPVKDIHLPITLNGQIPPGCVDRFRFSARTGQKLVVIVRARELIPYISDAVPGWFNATASLLDAKGQELAYSDDYQFHPDPVIFYKVPANGDYVLHIRDALYRGREDFVYRVTIGELPFVAAVFPLGGRVGSQATLAASGWNLPFQELSLDLTDKAPGVFTLSQSRFANPLSLAADDLPEYLEKEPNNTAATAHEVALPVIVNGHVDSPRDVDVFRVTGAAGGRIVAEVYARRLNSPLDSMLIATDDAGKRIALNDDHEDQASGLSTHHADSCLALSMPASGVCFIHVGDTQQDGGPAHAYRLRISPPRPDFELRATPSSLNVHGGAGVPVTVHVQRKDGFDGPIALSAPNAPQGFTLSGALIPAKQDRVRFTLDSAPGSRMESFDLWIEGRAVIQGRQVVRAAVPADDMTQSFAYHHLVPAQEQRVSVTGRFRPGDASRILTPVPLKILSGGVARVQARMPIGPRLSQVEYELSEPPDGLRIRSVTPLRDASEFLLETDAGKLKPGLTGNLIITATARAPDDPQRDVGGAARRIRLGALPAIPFEIVGPN